MVLDEHAHIVYTDLCAHLCERTEGVLPTPDLAFTRFGAMHAFELLRDDHLEPAARRGLDEVRKAAVPEIPAYISVIRF